MKQKLLIPARGPARSAVHTKAVSRRKRDQGDSRVLILLYRFTVLGLRGRRPSFQGHGGGQRYGRDHTSWI